MQKLCHVLAVEKQIKTTSGAKQTVLYHNLQKDALLNGIARTYAPLNEDGEKFPDEKQLVQFRLSEALAELRETMTPLYDVVATKDMANCSARADVEVDGVVILRDVPAVTLLYLEKQLVDVHTLVSKLGELTTTENWHYDSNTDSFKSDEVRTAKTKKIAKPFIKYAHTEQHPAQVDVVTEDIVAGYWTTVKYSGAMQRDAKRKLVLRTEKLLASVKRARETANQVEAPAVSIAEKVFGYLMA